MAEIEFTRQEIESLAAKVSALQPQLNESERVLLLAIFAVAAERATPSGPNQVATLPLFDIPGQQPQRRAGEPRTLADLQQQLLNAYIPGNSLDSVTQGGGTFSIHEIGVNPPPPPSGPQPGPQG